LRSVVFVWVNLVSQKRKFEKAVQAFQAGRFSEALELAERLARRTKPESTVLELAGTAAVRLGRLAHARTFYLRLTRRHPHKASFWAALGFTEYATGAALDAARSYAEAAKLEPHVVDHVYFEGLSLAKAGAHGPAAARFEKVFEIAPEHPGALWGLANVRREQGRSLEAMPLIQMALSIARCVDAATWMDYAETAVGVLDLPEVRRALSCVDTEMINDVDILARAAMVHSRLGEQEAGRGAIARAIGLQPDNPEILSDAASIENDAGDFDNARRYYQKIIDSHPKIAKAYFGLSQLKTFSADLDEDVAFLDRMLNVLTDAPDDPPFLHFAIGKVCADQSRFDESFQHFKQANDMRRDERPYSRHADLDRVRFCLEHFSADSKLLDGARQHQTNAVSPIFIVGMPRSGTSLVEQIVGAHPGVTALGELMLMPFLVADMYRDEMSSPSAQSLADAGFLYRERAGQMANGTRRTTDKLPYNIFNVGEIIAAMPDAKIIIMRRSAGDIGLSCYATPFNRGLDFANDLADIGFTIRLTEQLDRHWHTAVPGNVLGVSYEDLVENPEEQIRRILTFTALPWDDACLRFNEYKRRVGTASFVQVSKPMYRTSVSKWRRYVGQLAPLMNALNEC